MNNTKTHSALRSSRLRRRLIRHHLPLFLASTLLMVLLSNTYNPVLTPTVNVYNPNGQGASSSTNRVLLQGVILARAVVETRRTHNQVTAGV